MGRRSTVEDFWRRVQRGGPDECWIWTGANDGRRGYGVFRHKDRKDRTHRWSWMFEHGEIPDGMHVLHRCDNPPCVNPAHLWLGTHLDNMKDRDEKRRNVPRDRRGGSHKLTAEQADEIRRRWVPGRSGSLPGRGPNGNTRQLAEEFGVSTVMVWKLGTGRA